MTPDELPRDSHGIRVDVRGNRDLVFNNWHRENLGRNCYVTDVDFLEYRIQGNNILLKAIFEVKEWHVTQPRYIEDCANFKAIKMLAELSNIPFYFIWYEKEGETINRFKLWNVFNQRKEEAREMTPTEFKAFVESL